MIGHEAWFSSARPPFDWSFVFEGATLAAVAGAIVAAAVWVLLARVLPTPEIAFLKPLGRLAPWIPRLLAVHAGVSLLAQSARGTYLAPALDLPAGAFGTALAIGEGLIGVWLIAGYRVRPAALLLVAAGPLGMLRYGVIPMLERVDLLGIALFLVILPPGDDHGGAVRPREETVARAMLALRALVGTSLILLAFTEKLARPALALDFLEKYPAFNVMRSLGLNVGDLTFIRIAGAVELLFGILILMGVMPQLAVIIAGIPFNATLFFLGAGELIGHLPIYGAMLALLVYGSSTDLAAVVRWMPARRRPAIPVPGG